MSSVATRFPRPPGRGARLGVDVAVRRVVVGYRLVGAIWATLLGVLALLGQTPGQVDRGVVAGTLALVWGWTLLTVLLAERREAILTGWPWVAADVAVGAWAITASAVAGSRGISIAGGWPFAVVLLAVWARGFAGGLVTALVLSAVAVFRLASVGLPPATLPAASEAVGSALVYLAGAAVGSWGIGVLRRAEADRLAVEQALSSERAERRLAEERAETAAHLHDSVLQTLALIQRRSDDPVEVVGLARRQERELRGWLSGVSPATGRFAAALRLLAEEVEAVHRVAVDPVVVGDDDLDEGLLALLAASREALVNAARHAGVDTIDVYAEVDSISAEVFVRDRGVGFEPAAVDPDRRGLRDSVVGRMRRHGGTADVRSVPGVGTEVVLRLERGGAAADDPGGAQASEGPAARTADDLRS